MTMSDPLPSREPVIEIIRLPLVCKMTGLGKTTIYELELTNRFPKRIKIGIRAVGWLNAEVKEWLAKRLANRPTLEWSRARAPLRKAGGR
jgi:prophage regulatory protein